MLTFTFTLGGPVPPSQSLPVECVDCATRLLPMNPIGAVLKSSAPWLILNPLSGNTSFNTTVSINPTGMIAGTYTATIGLASTSEPVCNPAEVETVQLKVLTAPLPTGDTVPPTITFVTPNGASFRSNDVTVRVAPKDSVGGSGVVRVELFRAGLARPIVVVEESRVPTTTYLRWQAMSIPLGTYVLTAVATDAAGNKSAPATVTLIRK